MRVIVKDCNTPLKFKTNAHKSGHYKGRTEEEKETINLAIKEATEDAEINYGLDDYLKPGDKQFNKVFSKYYIDTYTN